MRMSNFFLTTPMSRCELKSEGHGKLSIHFASDLKTIQTIFRIIAFANQLSLYGAVAKMCEECESIQDRSGQPDVLMGKSIVRSEIKAEVLLQNDEPAYPNKQYVFMRKESDFFMDAGFIRVVEIGLYFMTKHNGKY